MELIPIMKRLYTNSGTFARNKTHCHSFFDGYSGDSDIPSDIEYSQNIQNENYLRTPYLLNKNFYELESLTDGYKPLDSRKKEGQGVLLFAYSNDNSSAIRYFEEAYDNALRMIEMDDQIQICIFASHPTNVTLPSRIQIQIIPIYHIFYGVSSSYYKTSSRQFRTRVLYYGFTPFQTTLALDSSSTFCISNAATKILNFFKTTDVDFSCASRTLDRRFCSGHAILYNWNSRTQHFLRNVFYATLDDPRSGDDQKAFKKALSVAVCANTIHFKWFSNTKLYAGNNYDITGRSDRGVAYRLSPPLFGPVYIVHESRRLCPILNQEKEIDLYRIYCVKHIIDDGKLTSEQLAKNKTRYDYEFFAHNLTELNDCIAPYPLPNIIYPLDAPKDNKYFVDF
ncbi:hypothetical protein WA158_007347 [Blastocystis sp. Blastoise]